MINETRSSLKIELANGRTHLAKSHYERIHRDALASPSGKKAHRIGRVTKDKHGKPSQQVIAQFKSFSERTAVYSGRKKARGGVREKLGLTKKQLSLMNDAAKLAEGLECDDFVFADVDCNTVAKHMDGKFLFFN